MIKLSFFNLYFSFRVKQQIKIFFFAVNKKLFLLQKKFLLQKCAKAPKMRMDWCTKKSFSRLNLSLFLLLSYFQSLWLAPSLKDFSFFVGLSKLGLFSLLKCAKEKFLLNHSPRYTFKIRSLRRNASSTIVTYSRSHYCTSVKTEES